MRLSGSFIGIVGALCALTLTVGCGSSDPPNGSVRCAASPPYCPAGYACLSNRCWRAGTGPDGSAATVDTATDATGDGRTGKDAPSLLDVGADATPLLDTQLALDAPSVATDGPAAVDEAATVSVDATASDAAVDQPLPPAPDAPLASHDDAAVVVPDTAVGPEVTTSDATQPCSTRTFNETAGIFVLASSTATSNCGDRVLPCPSIHQGIALAKSLGRSVVYVGAGKYTETVALAAGLRIEGGWSVLGSTWSPLCSNPASAVQIDAPSNANTTVVAKDLGGQATLALVTVNSKASAAPGESLYGVLATGTSTKLQLEDVYVALADAGAGQDGQPGRAGGNGSSAGCTPAGAGAPATAVGRNGDNGTSAGFGATGYTAGDGAPGVDGQAGQNGPAGSNGTCVTTCGTCPSASSASCSSAADSCGTNATPGCGGGAGIAGGPGSGGGSSIALYAWGATVQVSGGSFHAGNGGKGGTGGLGGQGGVGQPGKDGKAGTPCDRCSISSSYTGSPSTLVYSCAQISAGQGAAGVANAVGGGNGTAGGNGGSGAGGSSFAIYTGGQASVTTAATPAMSVGQAGLGGGSASAGLAKTVGP